MSAWSRSTPRATWCSALRAGSGPAISSACCPQGARRPRSVRSSNGARTNIAFEIGRRRAATTAPLLIIDYGHAKATSAIPCRRSGSMLSPIRCRRRASLDVTAHVDFEALGAAAESMGAAVHGPIDAGRIPAAARHRGARRRVEGGGAGGKEAAEIDAARRAAHRSRTDRHGPPVQGDGGSPIRSSDPCPDLQSRMTMHVVHRLSALVGHPSRVFHPRGRGVGGHLCEPQWRRRLEGRRRACRRKSRAHGKDARRRAGEFRHRLSDPFARCGRRRKALARGCAAESGCDRDAGSRTCDRRVDGRLRTGPVRRSRRRGVIGAAHAGWRGAFGGVIEATHRRDGKARRRPQPISSTALGPMIRQPNYEVGTRILSHVSSRRAADNERFFQNGARPDHSCSICPAISRRVWQLTGVRCNRGLRVLHLCGTRPFLHLSPSLHRSEPDYGRHVNAIVLSD